MSGRLAGKPTIELFGLTGKEPAPGVFCILTDDFQRSLPRNPVDRAPEGKFFIHENLPGWGIDTDETKLRPLAAAVVE